MCSTQSCAVGLELRRTERTDDQHEAALSDNMLFERSIMHRVVPATLFDAVVQYEASADALCDQLGVGRSEALLLCFATRDDALFRCANGKQGESTPLSVLDATHTPLETVRFERLFQPLSEEETRFASLLTHKLRLLCEDDDELDMMTVTNNDDDAVKRARGSSCGFSRRVHRDISVVSDGVGIMKTGRGLYRSTKSVGTMDVRKRARYYFETVVVDDVNAGGICIGISSEELPLNKLLGSDEYSCGFHSSGQLVRRNGSFEQFAERGFGRGDRVGVLVRRLDAEDVGVAYFVNGSLVGECVMKGLAEVGWLWATVCLYREGSKVVLQCCRRDWTVSAQQFETVLEGARREKLVSCICCSSGL